MYNKYLIIASKKNIAGMNIASNLEQFRKNPVLSGIGNSPTFDFYFPEEESIFNESLDLEKINRYDFIIFASTHKSEKGGKTLSIHAPGNWRIAELGGVDGKVCPSSALFQKQLFEKLRDVAKEFELDKKYELTLECTHHGPIINKPCVFIELGSSEEEWKDRRAGFALAKVISETITNFKPNPYNEIAIGIGGPHYCPNFNKIQMDSNVAISHIIPQYVAPITEEIIQEAIKKTAEEVDFILLDWKGLGISEQRQQIIDILERNYIQWKKTSDIDKD
jgi:D-aminoacyl-tRNA deacylase